MSSGRDVDFIAQVPSPSAKKDVRALTFNETVISAVLITCFIADDNCGQIRS